MYFSYDDIKNKIFEHNKSQLDFDFQKKLKKDEEIENNFLNKKRKRNFVKEDNNMNVFIENKDENENEHEYKKNRKKRKNFIIKFRKLYIIECLKIIFLKELKLKYLNIM